MAEAPHADIKAAIVKGAIVDAVLVGAGFVLYAVTGQIAWLIGAFVVGASILVLLLAQAGAFNRKP